MKHPALRPAFLVLFLVSFLVPVLLVSTVARAQVAKLPAPAADTLQSPEVTPDHRVTFRLRAPKAGAVTIAGEWSRAGGAPNDPQAMRKDSEGIWSITLGPLEPNIYIYTYNVDGMTIVDPIDPLVKLRARGAASMVEISGGQPWEPRAVPHGTLTVHTQASKVQGGEPRQIVVYTPPGYEQSRGRRFPVLYLLHGNNDLAVGWTMCGRAHLVFDNLLADKKMTPMVVVMPWGHALPFGTKPPAGQPSNNDLFERYLLEDVAPLVEASYRIAPGRQNHAIVGLSMGGGQALQIVMGHPDRFSELGVFGSGLTRDDFEGRYGKAVAGLVAAKTRVDPIFIGVGTEDGGRPKVKELADALRAHGTPATYHEVDGGHTYGTWRKLLVEAAPALFPTTRR